MRAIEKIRKGMTGKSPQSGIRFVAVYTIAFAAIALAVFIPFLIGGRSFVWSVDGLTQHVKALSYFGMYLRAIVEALFSGQGFQVPGFSFSIGYGADVVDTLNYYAIGDPLNLLAVFVPEAHTPVLYTVLVLVRFYLSGLAFSLYVRYVFDPPQTGLLVAALTYTFCGFALFAGVRHPYFLNPLIYFPLVIYGVEKVLRERKHVVFALAIALAAVSNFYFFYMIFLLMALYIVMRLFALHRREGLRAGLRAALGQFARLVGAGVVGVLIACIVFVPAVLFFLQDSRQSVEAAVPLLYPLDYYRQLLLSASTMNDPGNWSFLSTGIVGVLALVVLFFERERGWQMKVSIIVMAVMLCVPWVGHAFNGFSYVANRWCWAFSFAVCCVIAARWNVLTGLSRKRVLAAVAIVAAYVVVSVLLNLGLISPVGLAIVSACWLASLIAIAFVVSRNARLKTERSARFASVSIALIACAGILLNSFALYSSPGADYASRFVRWSETADVYDTEATAFKRLEQADHASDFHRYSASRDLTTRNAGMLEGVSSTASYWSLANTHTKDFFWQMGINGSDSGGCCWYDLNGQSTLIELVGTSDFFALPQSLLPYGFSGKARATGAYYDPRNQVERSYEVFGNERALPFGFTYDSALTVGEFSALEPRERRESVLQSCVIGDPSGNRGDKGELPAGIARGRNAYDSVVVAHTLKAGKDIELSDGSFTVDKANASLVLKVDGVPNTEPSVQFTGLKPAFPVDSIDLKVKFTFADGVKQERVLPLATPDSNTYEPYRWLTVGPGYSASPLESVEVTFPRKGVYQYEDVQVIAQPFDSYAEHVAALTENVLYDVDLHYVNAETAATNRVTGSISLDEPKVLCTQIPYSEGWRAYVDGQEVELYQLNVLLSGVALDAGEHRIEFVYETPGLRLGAILTLVGLVALVFVIALERRKPAMRH